MQVLTLPTPKRIPALWRSPGYLVTLAAVALAFALPLPHANRIAGLPSVCPFFEISGLPCPGCGLTRAWVLFAHGHWAQAFCYHPLGPPLFMGALLYLAVGLIQPQWLPGPRAQRFLGAGLATALLVFGALRIFGWYPWPG